MKLQDLVEQLEVTGNSSTGTWKLDGAYVDVDNSGYGETFFIPDIANGVKTGWFMTVDQLEDIKGQSIPDDQIQQYGWQVSVRGDEVIIKNPDIMYAIPAEILRKI